MMYSHYFSKPKKNANLLRLTLPGFTNPIDVPFQGKMLPVCTRCKKNYKTREHCRGKECHYGLPWTSTPICITLDPSCTNSDGKLVDGPFIANGVPNTAYQYAVSPDPSTQSCGLCKEKNYTRTYCRQTKKHRALPWNTAYVVLSLRQDGGSTSQADEEGSTKDSDKTAKRRKVTKIENEEGLKEETKDVVASGTNHENEEKTKKTEKTVKKQTDAELEVEAAKLQSVNPSRTFLCTVSDKEYTIEWLEYDAVQYVAQSRIREEFNQKMHEEAMGYPPPPYGMMYPSFGMNPYFQMYPHLPAPKEEDGGNGETGGGPSSPGGNNPWGMHGGQFPPPPQDVMYGSPMGFDPRMMYGFPPQWARHPMDGGMQFDGQNPMMHQMGYGGGGFYPGPMSPHAHPGDANGNTEMPQAYDSNPSKMVEQEDKIKMSKDTPSK